MHPSAPSGKPSSPSPLDLEDSLADVESRLSALGAALRARDPSAIDVPSAATTARRKRTFRTSAFSL